MNTVEAPESLSLCLYVAGRTPTAQKALANLKAICDAHLADAYNLRVVDLVEDPERAEAAQIIAIPTLVRESPAPIRRIVGDLSDTARVLAGLGIHPSS